MQPTSTSQRVTILTEHFNPTRAARNPRQSEQRHQQPWATTRSQLKPHTQKNSAKTSPVHSKQSDARSGERQTRVATSRLTSLNPSEKPSTIELRETKISRTQQRAQTSPKTRTSANPTSLKTITPTSSKATTSLKQTSPTVTMTWLMVMINSKYRD